MQWGNAEPFAPPITGLSIEVLARLQEWTRTRRFLGRAPVGGDALLARLYPGGHLSTSASGSSAPRRGWAGRGRRRAQGANLVVEQGEEPVAVGQ